MSGILSLVGGSGTGSGVGQSGSFYPHTIGQSLRITTGDSAYLSRTSVSGGSTNTMTFSAWVKRFDVGVYHLLWYGKGSNYDAIWIGEDNEVQVIINSTSSGYPKWSAKLRDVSGWFNIVVKIKMDESTDTDRVKLYINGVDQGVASNGASAYPPSSATFAGWLGNTNVSYMGFDSGSTYGGGMVADVNVLDGVAAGPGSFGSLKNGIWVPVDTSGLTFGANGFRLEFANKGTATTSEGTTATQNIGDDSSGQGHNFAVTQIEAHDVLIDSPTNNFPTYNPLNKTGQTLTHNQGNLEVASSSTWSSSIYSRMTMAGIGGSSGKFYAEFCNHGSSGGGSTVIGIGNYESLAGGTDPTTYHNDAVIYYYDYITSNLTRVDIGGNYASPPGISGNEVLRMAWDCSNGKVWIGGSQEWFDVGSGVGDPANGNNPSGTISSFSGAPIGVLHNRASNAGRCIINFGQNGTFNNTLTAGGYSDENGVGDFFYAVPSGFLALCSASLPETSISPNASTQASSHFDVILWTGNGTNAGDEQEINGLSFQPDWVWTKGRGGDGSNPASGQQSHELHDSVRGAGKRLFSNSTSSESDVQTLKSFDSDGFTVAMGTGAQSGTNQNTTTMVGWCWQAGGATPSKTYKVVVDNDGANKYRFRNSADSATFATYAPTVTLQEGGTYVFDWSDDGTNGAVSAQGHPIRFSTTSDGTHGGGTEYTTGVVKDDSAYTTTITVAAGAPTLYYYCQNHSGMGGQVNTNSTHGSSNFDGTLVSVNSVNETAGFSIVTWDANGASTGTLGHGLTKAPSLILAKPRDFNGTNWFVQVPAIFSNTYILNLDSAAAAFDPGGNHFNDTEPTSSVFSFAGYLGDHSDANGNDLKLAYCFNDVDGFFKCGEYQANNSTDGPFIYLGFRPRLIWFKRHNSTGGGWRIIDTARDTINVCDARLFIETNGAEDVSRDVIDINSNGFKLRANNSGNNGTTTNRFFYAAWAEAPFKYSNSR